LLGPFIGAVTIKYFENIFSAFNDQVLNEVFGFLPDIIQGIWVPFASLFVGKGWHLTLGVLFMLVVIFLPGGAMEGFRLLKEKFFKKESETPKASSAGGAE